MGMALRYLRITQRALAKERNAKRTVVSVKVWLENTGYYDLVS
jgi:hypothetical protein